MDVLDFDCRFIDENSNGECETSERHDIDGLAGRPEPDDGCDTLWENIIPTSTK